MLEPLLAHSENNLSLEGQQQQLKKKFFDWLLYFNLPIIYGIIGGMVFVLSTQELVNYEITGLVLSIGIMIGTCGINVGHELGHRSNKTEQLLAKALLLPALYMHFFIEHNRGHHKNVATPLDPASARYGDMLYIFGVRSTVGSYLNAWKLESQRLHQAGLSFWSIHHEMILFQFLQLTYLGIIWRVSKY